MESSCFAFAKRLWWAEPECDSLDTRNSVVKIVSGDSNNALVNWAAMALQDNSDFQPGLRIAAASNAMAGRPEQAHQAVARLRQLIPSLRVSNLKDVLGPYRHAEDLSRYEEGLRQAGLPE